MKKMKRLLALVLAMVMALSMAVTTSFASDSSATISFADKGTNRTVFTTEQQVWEQNGITFINDKGSSITNVADYGNPVRLYKGSNITVQYPGMTSIVFACNNASYATALQSTIGDSAEVSGKIVTVTLEAAADSYKVEGLGAQVRLDSIDVYTTGTPDAPAEPKVIDSTIADVIALGVQQTDYTFDMYKVTGVITDVYHTTYGNMYITDGNGNTLTIYGTYSADGSTRYDEMETKPVAGDTVTIVGVVGQFQGTAQIKDGMIVAHTPAVEEVIVPETVSLTVADGMTFISGDVDGAAWYVWTAEADSEFGIYPFADGLTVTVHDDMTQEGTVISGYTTMNVETGDVKYICVSGTGSYSVSLYNKALPGSYENPVYLQEFPATYTVAAGKTVYFKVNPDSVDYSIKVTGENFSGISNGETIPSVDGAWTVDIPVPAFVMGMPAPVIFGVQNTGSADVEYGFETIYPEGAQSNPVIVGLGEVTVTNGLVNHYLNYTATTHGILSVTVQDQTSLGDVILRSPSDSFQPWYAYDAVDGEISVNVSTGDTVEIELQGPFNWMTRTGSPVTGTITLSFESTECTPVTDAAVSATCTESGLTEGSHCSDCGKVLVAQEVVPANGHTVVADAAVAPTCTETGLTEGSHCSVCNEIFEAQTVVAAKGHTVVVDAAVAPTCTETGLTEGSHCSVCNEVLVAQTVVAANGHTVVVVPGAAATCTENGLTDGKYCSVCNVVLATQEVIPAGHTVVVDAAVAATCTTPGCTEGSHCSACNEIIVAQTVVAATGHNYGSNGKCTVCGAVNPDSPKTGDTAPVAAMAALAVLAAGAFIVLTKKRRA